MNFDHWKDVQEPVAEPAAQNSNATARRAVGRPARGRDPGSARPIPIARAYTRMPSGSRKGSAKLAVFLASAPVEEIQPGAATRHFVASDPAPDMDLAFADIDRGLA